MKYVIIIILITIFSCKKTGSHQIDGFNQSEIDNLDIYFITSGTTFPSALDCGFVHKSVAGNTLLNKKIKQKETLLEFDKLYDKLTQSIEKEDSQDTRIRCLVYFKSGKVDTLCLGEFFGTYINGLKIKDSPDLLKLIKKELDYENSYKRIKDPF